MKGLKPCPKCGGGAERVATWYADGGNGYTKEVVRCTVGDCPVCGRTVDNNEHYCFSCGQRLDWEADK